MFTTFRAVLGLLLVFAASLAGAAELHNLRQDPQLLEQLKGESGNAADPAFRAALGLGANEGLEVVRTYDDGHGGTVTRYRQTLRGIPVWDEQIVIGWDASGKVNSLHGRAVSDLAAGLQRLQPTLTAQEALAAMESRVRASFGKTKPIYRNEKSDLVIYLDDGTPRLSYAVSFFADSETGGQPTRPTFIVDAQSGQVLFEFDGLTHLCNAGCTLLDQSGLSGSRRHWQYFQVTVPSDVSESDLLEISISGGSGDADLYTRLGQKPTLSSYDCRPYLNGNNESCSAPAKAGDVWYIGLYAYSSYSGVSLVARVRHLSPADGTGPGGNAKTGAYSYGQDFGPLSVVTDISTCIMNNIHVKTVNLNQGTSGTTAFNYGDGTNCYNDSDRINDAYSPLNDAHYFGGVVFDMYQAYVGVPPLTFQLMMRVHYSNNYENAFWDGSSMTFGDGYTTFYPLVALDVSAHEVSHGFTEQNSNLTYSGEPGGINEAYSDIAGEAAEYFMLGSNDFLVGAEIFKAPNGALRYMCNPPQDGKSVDNVNDYYAGLDVHYSSGIYNKAFCVLAKTTGWTTEKAFQSFARANQLYWTSSTSFVDGAQGVVDAAAGLGGNPQDVMAAFAAVGINNLVDPGGGSTATPPAAPSGLSAAAVSDSQINLSWTDNADNEDGFEVWSSADGAATEKLATVGPDITSYSVTGLDSVTTYSYQVKAYNSVGYSDYSDPASATTEATPSISLSATGYKVKGVQYVDLSWTGATGAVDIYRDGSVVATDVSSPYTDNIGAKGGGVSYVYHVCEIVTLSCSYDVTVNF